MYLPRKTSKKRLSEAEQARQNRAGAIKAWSSGKISRRDLVKMGLRTAAGSWAFVNGLSPYAPSAYAAGTSIPTGAPPSPLFGVQAFTTPMPRFDVLTRNPVASLSPAPT
ncbi:MAG: hypothetical protein ACJ79R_06640, partial [Anaeromyxobacteraceae bacterium]